MIEITRPVYYIVITIERSRMIAKIIRIGNSRGIRIPGHVLKQLNIKEQVEMIINDKKQELVLKPLREPRKGWDESFSKMRTRSDDELIIDDTLDLDGWEW